MLGLLITGHGHFATGMQSSLELIAGKQEKVEFVNFEESDSIENLSEKLAASLEKLSECEGVLVLADLVGGSPFKTAVEATAGKENFETVGGANLPMIIEMSLARNFAESVQELSSMAIQSGKDGIMKFEMNLNSKEIEEEDGI